MPAGQIIGRISVKVLPDTDEFKQRAKAALTQIEEQLNFKVKVELDKNSLRDVKRQLENWRKGISPIKIVVRPDLLAGSTTLINARLRALSRPREIKLIPRLDEGAVARVATALAALSGARVLNNIFEDMFQRLMRLDEAVPLIGTLALAIAGLGSVGITAVSNLAALSASLASIAPAALALPGIFGGIAIALGVMVAALVDTNKVLPGVGDAFREIQDQISVNFWAKAAEPIRELISTLLPQLSAGLQATATELGSYFGSLAKSLKGAFDGALAGMFADLHASIAIASTGTEALAGIIRTLGEVGAGYLPRLAQWFVDITTQFNTFLGAAAADGRLQGWIDTAITALGELARVLGNLGSIFAGIASAATAGGGSTLSMVADTLGRVAAAINSVDGQNTLTAVFSAAHEAMSRIATISGPALTEFFGKLADLLTVVLPVAGDAIGTLLAGLATGLSQPGLSEGLTQLFSGLLSAVMGLLPAFAPLGQALGQVASVVAVLAKALGPILGVALQAVSTILAALLPAIQPLVEILGGVLMQVIQALAPLLQILAVLIGGILTAVMPLITPILQLVMMALQPLLEVIGTLVAQFMPPLLLAFNQLVTALMPVIELMRDQLAQNMKFLIPIIQFLGEILLSGLVSAIKVVASIITGLVDVFRGVITFITGVFTGDWEKAWEGIKQIFSGILTAVVRIIKSVLEMEIFQIARDWGMKFGAWWRGLWDDFLGILKKSWDGGLSFIRSIPGRIMEALGNLRNLLINAGKDLIEGFIQGIKDMFGNVKDTLTNLTKKLTDWKGPESTDKTLLVNAGQLIIDGLIKGMESRYGAVRKSLEGLTGDIGGMALASPTIGGVQAANLSDRVSASIDSTRDGEGGVTKVLNYYAAPGSSIDSEEDLFKAAGRARMVGW